TSNAAFEVAIPATVTNTVSNRISALRNHTITINEDGEVQGRVASINHKTKAARGVAETTVYFIQNGKIVKKGYSNEDGTFVVAGLKEGIYSFVASGEYSFATCGVNVVKSAGDQAKYLEVAAISPNVAAIREIIDSNLPEPVRRDVAKNLKALEVRPSNVMGSNRVELDGDVLRGQIVSLLNDNVGKRTKAHLFRGNSKVQELKIAENGAFEVEGVSAGVYDIVVVGTEGIAAVSFEAVADADETAAYTALQDNLFSNFIVALAPQADAGCISGCGGVTSDAVVYGDSPVGFLGDRLANGIAGGGCCGGAGTFQGFGGCCGGGGLGGGRFGGLLGGLGGRGLLLPAIAAGIAIPLAVGGESEANAN
ncbi:MAG: hypothetical protein AAGA30_17345, partial [Planctomycetota bacterium]